MSDWQHTIASWIVAGAVFVVLHLVSAPISALVWHLRNRIGFEHVKSVLALFVVLPSIAAGMMLLTPSAVLCPGRAARTLDWMMSHIGADALRLFVILFAGVLFFWLIGLVYRASFAVYTILYLRRNSCPPSDKLRRILQGMIPATWHCCFREVQMPSQADGVYARWCFLSSATVAKLPEEQLRVVVAHEYEHLRAYDGWLALIMGIAAVGGVWSGAHRRWVRAAELLADSRVTRKGIAPIELARVLVQRQAQAQGMALGFRAEGSLLEERLRYLLSPRVDRTASRSGWLWYSATVVCVGWFAYALWGVAEASTCTVHCLFFR